MPHFNSFFSFQHAFLTACNCCNSFIFLNNNNIVARRLILVAIPITYLPSTTRIVYLEDFLLIFFVNNRLKTSLTWQAITYFNQPIWLHSRWSVELSISVVAAAALFSWVRCSDRSVRLCLLVGASVLAFLAATGSTAVRITRSVSTQFSRFYTNFSQINTFITCNTRSLVACQ